jgi:hypothetical protein
VQTSEQCIEDLAHAFDLTSSVVAARAPLESNPRRRGKTGQMPCQAGLFAQACR